MDRNEDIIFSSEEGLVAAGLYFDSYVRMLVPDGDEALLRRMLELCGRYESLFSPAGTDEHEPETAELAALADKITELTGGAFDARFSGKLDLGGIAKGYIAEKLAELIHSAGVNSAMLDLGGNVLVVGSRPDGMPWRVGIQDPFDETKLVRAMAVRDCAVVTSGTYRRGEHIIDPRTGGPADAGLVSATVISHSATLADALATACIVLGSAESSKLIDMLPGTEAVFIEEKSKKITVTGGLRSV